MAASLPSSSGWHTRDSLSCQRRVVASYGRLRSAQPRHSHLRQVRCTAAATELKQQLIDAIVNGEDPGFAGMPPAALQILDQMEAEAKTSKPKLLEEELLGDFDGVASRIVLMDNAGEVSLGKFSFMQFKPTELKVKVIGGKTVTNRRGHAEPYAIISNFRIAEGEFEGLEGTQKAIAEWDLDEKDPARMAVTFVATKIQPRHEKDLERWMAAFKEHNALDENGVWTMSFDKGRTGYRDFVYVDKDFQVSKGNRGSWTVLERKHE